MPKRKNTKRADIRHIVVVSDIHAGSSVAVRPPEFVRDDGDFSRYSDYQEMLWECWQYFWYSWVPHVTGGEPYAVVVNGDALEGRHHRSTTSVSENLADQHKIALALLDPIRKAAAKFYMVRGTEAHVGPTAEQEEMLARLLCAEQNHDGGYSFWDLWIETPSGWNIHLAHHIGTTSSMAYESSALMRELAAAVVEAGRWGELKPDLIVRSHRHSCCEVAIPTDRVESKIVVTPAWQLHTPFTYKHLSMRIPQIGGICIIDEGKEEPLTVRKRIWSPGRRGSLKV